MSTEDFTSQSLDVSEPERKLVSLPENYEWRFEVDFDSKVTVRLVDGAAEVFGTELASGREYEFSGQNAAVFTYHGCKLEWEGKASEYVAHNPTMARYANIHFALENMRRKSVAEGSSEANSLNYGPNVLILGPKDSGKSTLAKILVSYGVKMGSFPMLVNLDTENPVLSPPGSVIAAPVSHILDVEYGFGMPPINGPASTHHKQPLVYNYGLQLPTKSPAFYDQEIELLASGIFRRLESDTKVRESGLIIDTPNVFADVDNEEVQAKVARVIEQFKVNIVFVIGKERLVSQLEKTISSAKIYNVPQSGGVVETSDAFVRQVQRRYISQYFFGTNHMTLSPFTVSISLNDITVFRPLEQNEVGINTESTNNLLTRVEPSAVLQNCLLAVVNAEPGDSVETIQKAETLGYVHVVEADETKQILKILLPVPGRVPKKVYIMGEYRYAE